MEIGTISQWIERPRKLMVRTYRLITEEGKSEDRYNHMPVCTPSPNKRISNIWHKTTLHVAFVSSAKPKSFTSLMYCQQKPVLQLLFCRILWEIQLIEAAEHSTLCVRRHTWRTIWMMVKTMMHEHSCNSDFQKAQIYILYYILHIIHIFA